jgi:TonB family protein
MKSAIKLLFSLLLLISGILLFAQDITPPQCYGGKRLLKEFIKEEMVYPGKALENNTEGIVEMSFIIKPDGTTTDLKVTNSVSGEIDSEAIRILKKILWAPATELGRPIAYLHTFKIKFDINKYKKICKARGYDKINYLYKPVDSSNKVFPFIDTDISPKPKYSSKDYNFSSFISNNLEYPEAAFKQNISGTVKLKFVVEPSGRITNIIIYKAVGGGCTEEAIRVVKLIRWKPGINNNLSVRTWMCLEITFDIAKRTVAGKIPTPGQVH